MLIKLASGLHGVPRQREDNAMTNDESSLGPAGPEAVVEWRLHVLQKVFTYMFVLLAAVSLVETILSLHTPLPAGLARDEEISALEEREVLRDKVKRSGELQLWAFFRRPWPTTSTIC